jgi:hypothetical protein
LQGLEVEIRHIAGPDDQKITHTCPSKARFKTARVRVNAVWCHRLGRRPWVLSMGIVGGRPAMTMVYRLKPGFSIK